MAASGTPSVPVSPEIAAGREERRRDVMAGRSRGLHAELRAFARSPSVQAAGRMVEWARPRPSPGRLDAPFLSGDRGTVTGLRAVARARAEDLALDALQTLARSPPRLARAAAAGPRRRVLALGVEREPGALVPARVELESSRHDVALATIAVGGRGRWENLDALLADHPPDGRDWLLLVDDDVTLPRGFLDAFLFLAERFDLALAQPAHRRLSHAAWTVTRRRAGSVARRTRFVEIGPVLALRADTWPLLLPFPPLRAGWGLDAHWAAIARRERWRVGVIDAVPISHHSRPVASSYSAEGAVAEAREFLAGREWLGREELSETLEVYRTW